MAKHSKKISLYELEWRTVSIRTIQIIMFSISGLILFTIWWFFLRQAATPASTLTTIIEESAAKFIDYEGKVEIKPRDEYVWKAASFKTDLHEGDRIRTAPDSSARIKFDDGTEITIQTDSIVVISKRNVASEKDQVLLAVVENGESDINAEKSASAPSVATAQIRRFRLAPGSTGTVTADQQTGQHTSVVEKGYGVVTDIRGTTTQLGSLEQLKISKDFTSTKIKLPFTPPLLSPAKGQIFEFLSDQGLTIELQWRDVSNAVRYHVQISESPLFGKIKAERTDLTKSSIGITIPKTQNKQYFWRVRSIDKDRNMSPWSEPFQFVVHSPSSNKPSESLDKTPPDLKITYMHPFLPYVQVEGKTEADAFLTLNGQIIDVKDDGSFVYTYTLQNSGWNDLKFVAEDPSGNQTTVTKKVEYR